MATKQGGKGKGRQTPAKALHRAACWERAQERHAANRTAQNERAANNRALRAAGEPTPWQKAKAKRRDDWYRDARRVAARKAEALVTASVAFSH